MSRKTLWRTAVVASVLSLSMMAVAQEDQGFDPELVEEGKRLYYEVAGTGCVACHGVAGLGDIGIAPNIRGVPAVRIEGALAAVEEMFFLRTHLDEDDLAALEAFLGYAETLTPASTTVRGGSFQPAQVSLPSNSQVQLIVNNGGRSACTLVVEGADEGMTIEGRSIGDVVWTSGEAGTSTTAYCEDEPDARLQIQIVAAEE